MIRDPIIEEIYQIREKIWEECGRDMDTYLKRLSERRTETGAPRVGPEEFKRRTQQREAR